MTVEPRVVNLSDYWDGHRFAIPPDIKRVDRRTKWGNPFKIGDRVGDQPMTREVVIHAYRSWLDLKLRDDPRFLDPLRGKRLGCWCKPEACHADVILEFLDNNAQ